MCLLINLNKILYTHKVTRCVIISLNFIKEEGTYIVNGKNLLIPGVKYDTSIYSGYSSIIQLTYNLSHL